MGSNSSPGPTLQQIAEAAGVSKAAVSFALNEKPGVSAQLRAKIQRTAEELGYRRSHALSQALRAVRRQQTESYRETIGVISPGIALDQQPLTGPEREGAPALAEERLRGFLSRAEELGVSLDFFGAAEMGIERLVKILQARGIERVLIEILFADYHTCLKFAPLWQNFACVVLGAPDLTMLGGVAVRPDYFSAGRRIAVEVFQAGFRRIILTTPLSYLNPDRRFEAGLQFAVNSLDREIGIHRQSAEDYELLRQGRLPENLEPGACFVGQWVRGVYENLLQPAGDFGWVDWHANLRPEGKRYAGIDQRDYDQARTALEFCLGLPRGGDQGRKGCQSLTTLEPDWLPGFTLPQLRNDQLHWGTNEPFPESAGEVFQPLPLAEHVDHDEGSRLEPGLLEDFIMPLPPKGQWVFHGIPFQLTGRTQSAQCVALGVKRPDLKVAEIWNLHENARIIVGHKARALYILHACAFSTTTENLGQYVVTYGNGKSREIPVKVLRDPGLDGQTAIQPEARLLADWWPGAGTIAAHATRLVSLVDAENRPGQASNLYLWRWENPQQAEVITSVTLQISPAARALLLFFGLTLAV